MATALPADFPTGRVVGKFFFLREDGADSATRPDPVDVFGKVKFTASVPSLVFSGSGGGAMAMAVPLVFKGTISANGLLEAADGSGVLELPATDSDLLNPRDWTWRVDFDLCEISTGDKINIPSFDFQVPAGDTVDLPSVVPVATSPGVITIMGPAGPNTVPTDLAIANAINTPTSETAEALNTAIESFDGNFFAPWTSSSATIPGAGFIVKSATINAATQGVIGWQHAHDFGYLMHFESRTGFKGAAGMIAVGLDVDGGTDPENPTGPNLLGGTAFFVSNKRGAVGFKVNNGNGNIHPQGYGYYGNNSSTVAPLMFLESTWGDAAPLLVLKQSANTGSTAQKLFRTVLLGDEEAGNINGKNGQLFWNKSVTISSTPESIAALLPPSSLIVTDAGVNPGIIESSVVGGQIANSNIQFFRPTGAVNQYWAHRLFATSDRLDFQSSAAAGRGLASYKTLITLKNEGLSFYGALPVVRAAAITSPPAPSATYVQSEMQAMKVALDAALAAIKGIGITL